MLKKTTYKLALVLLAVFATEGGLKRAAAGAMEATNSIENSAVSEIDSPAGAGSVEPNLSVGPDGRVYLSWLEPVQPKEYALKFAVRARGGNWSTPRRAHATIRPYPLQRIRANRCMGPKRSDGRKVR